MKLYNAIGLERRYFGFTMKEIGISCSILIIGFIMGNVILAIVGAIIGVMILKYIMHLEVKYSIYRGIWFYFGYGSQLNINSKYYL